MKQKAADKFTQRSLAYAVTLCILFLSICTTLALFAQTDTFLTKQSSVLYALYTNAVLMAVLLFLVVQDFRKTWSTKKSNGSIFHVKVIIIFSSFAVIPSLLMIFFSAIFFHKGIESWFTARNNAVLEQSLKVAESYLNEHKKVIRDDGFGIARAIEVTMASLTPSQLQDSEVFFSIASELIDELCDVRNIRRAILYDEQRNILARSRYSFSLNFADISNENIQAAYENGTEIIDLYAENKIFALVRLNILDMQTLFLLIEKDIDEHISGFVKGTQSAYNDYKELSEYRVSLEVAFILIFILLGLLLLISAIFAALHFASQFITPITALVDTAEQIKDGNLNIRAKRVNAIKELSVFINTFNDMVSKIQAQQIALEETNEKLDRQIQFVSRVLKGISSGVVGLNERLRINIFNEHAEQQIGQQLKYGTLIFDIFPDINVLFEKLVSCDIVDGQIEYIRGVEHRDLVIKISLLKKGDTASGYIVTFDDVTDLISAQRKAAWADVARRVAHEIKNPLTPIQLAAERISRKYSKQIIDDHSTFDKLINTITKQVGDIRRLADEFSFFARLPEPVLRKCDLFEIAKQAVFFMQNAYQDISVLLVESTVDTKMIGDERLIHQATINIIQNAVNAIKSENQPDKKGQITVSCESNDDFLVLKINDNGPGLPKVDRNVLTEPYFTLLPKGTGLGLAIVKKIVQDHNGDILLEDSSNGGACIKLLFPISRS